MFIGCNGVKKGDTCLLGFLKVPKNQVEKVNLLFSPPSLRFSHIVWNEDSQTKHAKSIKAAFCRPNLGKL